MKKILLSAIFLFVGIFALTNHTDAATLSFDECDPTQPPLITINNGKNYPNYFKTMNERTPFFEDIHHIVPSAFLITDSNAILESTHLIDPWWSTFTENEFTQRVDRIKDLYTITETDVCDATSHHMKDGTRANLSANSFDYDKFIENEHPLLGPHGGIIILAAIWRNEERTEDESEDEVIKTYPIEILKLQQDFEMNRIIL